MSNKINTQKFHVHVSIAPVKGGFILDYPVTEGDNINFIREVVPTERKAIQRLKEVLETFDSGEPAVETKE